MIKTMVTDDFSFPTVPNSPPDIASSTSLWRVPSLVFIQSCQEVVTGGGSEGVGEFSPEFKPDEEDERSFLICNNTKRNTNDNGDNGGGEEKMDMLWENFNDVELNGKSESMPELCGFKQGRNGSISTSSVLSPRRPCLVVLLKVLKKLLMLQNSHCSVRGRTLQHYKSV